MPIRCYLLMLLSAGNDLCFSLALYCGLGDIGRTAIEPTNPVSNAFFLVGKERQLLNTIKDPPSLAASTSLRPLIRF